MFNTPLLESFKLEQINTPNGRYYVHNDQQYHSVTTFLDKTADKSGLVKWRKKIGEAEAERITRESANRGTKLHGHIEKFLANKPPKKFTDLQESIRFNNVSAFLTDNVKTLYASELALFSNALKLAGTMDIAFVDKDDKLTIGDFKTAKKPKKLEWIGDYFLQISCYTLMIAEQYKLEPHQGLIMFSYDDGSFQPITFNPKDHMDTLYYRLQRFRQMLKEDVNAV